MRSHPSLALLSDFAAGRPAVSRGRLSDHLGRCTDCRHAITLMRAVVAAVHDDAVAPAGTFDAIRRRRLAGERVLLPVVEAFVPASTRSRMLRWAAALLLALGGAAAAMPGSPLRAWLARFGDERSVASVESQPGITSPTSISPLPPDSSVAGVSVPIGSGRVGVTIIASASLRLRLRLGDLDGVDIRATGMAVNATFTMRSDGVTIRAPRGGEIMVEVPRRLREFELTVGTSRYAVKTGSGLHVSAPADTIAGEIVFR